ncbi:MAG TPA: response regulator, partial [Chroococcidiopsis sp.]
MRRKLLIVEDERLIALDIKQRLVQLGYEVVAIANHADAALQAVTQHMPDLILMDIHLQGAVDGIALAAQIQQQFNLPVIFLTAHADSATLTQAKATQPFGYLVKPVETHMLSTAIEIALTRHQTEVAVQRALAKEKELNELKTRFISIVSHEFRNPLSAIKLIFDLLERQNPPVPPEQQQLHLQRG